MSWDPPRALPRLLLNREPGAAATLDYTVGQSRIHLQDPSGAPADEAFREIAEGWLERLDAALAPFVVSHLLGSLTAGQTALALPDLDRLRGVTTALHLLAQAYPELRGATLSVRVGAVALSVADGVFFRAPVQADPVARTRNSALTAACQRYTTALGNAWPPAVTGLVGPWMRDAHLHEFHFAGTFTVPATSHR